jgi:hypothetical protein
MRYPSHTLGDLCEAIALKELTARGYWVFTTTQAHSPIDLIGVAPGGEVLYIDCKRDRERVNPGRDHPSRITRARTEQQKLLGVEICYVNPNTETIIIPGR